MSITREEYISRFPFFPFKRLNKTDEDLFEMMNKLKNYDYKSHLVIGTPYYIKNIVLQQPPKFEGKYHLLKCSEDDYEDFNILSDMFCERFRMSARRQYSDVSPLEYFEQHKDELVETLEPEATIKEFSIALRDEIFKKNLECSSFRPNVFVMIAKMLNATRVLDFSGGWGDRLIGAIALGDALEKYVAIDPNVDLHQGYASIVDFFVASGGSGSENKFTFICDKAQNMNKHLDASELFDLVFTSPPYFNFELYSKYDDDYTNEGAWFNSFLKPVLEKCWSHISDEGYLAINLNQSSKSQTYISKMIALVSEFSDACYKGIISYVNEKGVNPQPIFVWKKTNDNTSSRFITIYEKAAFINLRVTQITHGKMRPVITNFSDFNYDPVRIAQYEVENKLIDLVLIRKSRGDEYQIHLRDCIFPQN